METPLQDYGKLLIPLEDGSWVPERIVHIVEAIRSYNPRLDVKWTKPESRGPDDSAFAIVEKTPDGREFVVFHVKDESEFDGRVLEKIIMADTSRRDIFNEMQARNEAVKLMQQKAAEEQMAEALDIAAHVIKSPLHKYKVNKDLVIKDYGNKTK